MASLRRLVRPLRMAQGPTQRRTFALMTDRTLWGGVVPVFGRYDVTKTNMLNMRRWRSKKFSFCTLREGGDNKSPTEDEVKAIQTLNGTILDSNPGSIENLVLAEASKLYQQGMYAEALTKSEEAHVLIIKVGSSFSN